MVASGSSPYQGALLSLLWPEDSTNDGARRTEGCPTKGLAEGGSVGVFPNDGACSLGGDERGTVHLGRILTRETIVDGFWV